MIRITNLFLTSRRLFRLAIQHPGITELERASSFLLKNRSSFAGNMECFGVSKKGHPGFPSKRGYILSTLRAASARLDSVIIENQPYERVLANYDAPETFFFLDPPYINTAGHNYSPWQEADIQTLCARLDKLKGKWLLTMNDMPCVRSLFTHCRITPISSRVSAGNMLTTAGRRMIELLIEPA
jgi:DNA adenine methylase